MIIYSVKFADTEKFLFASGDFMVYYARNSGAGDPHMCGVTCVGGTHLTRYGDTHLRRYFKTNSQLGTLLLDSLTAIAILAIVFAVSFPNYQRARLQAAVGVDAQQLDAINTAVVLYGNDHKGAYGSLTSGAVTGTNPGASYLSVAPVSPVDGASPYNLEVPGSGTAAYAVVDTASVTDNTLLGNYKTQAGTACGTTNTFLAEDPVHGVYCASTNTGTP